MQFSTGGGSVQVARPNSLFEVSGVALGSRVSTGTGLTMSLSTAA